MTSGVGAIFSDQMVLKIENRVYKLGKFDKKTNKWNKNYDSSIEAWR